MSYHTTAQGDKSPDSTRCLTDYMNEGRCFLESCRAYLDDSKRKNNPDGSLPYRQLDALKELLTLLQQPERDIDPSLAAIWLPGSFNEKEKRYRNYLLWLDFSTDGNNRTHRRPVLSEKALLRALGAGHNEFECKHHLFNLLVSTGFSKRQACLLAKYLGNRVTNPSY